MKLKLFCERSFFFRLNFDIALNLQLLQVANQSVNTCVWMNHLLQPQQSRLELGGRVTVGVSVWMLSECEFLWKLCVCGRPATSTPAHFGCEVRWDGASSECRGVFLRAAPQRIIWNSGPSTGAACSGGTGMSEVMKSDWRAYPCQLIMDGAIKSFSRTLMT